MSNTKDLDSSRAEALQGLLRSLGHTNDEGNLGAPLSTDQVQRLSEKIKSILGDVGDHDQTPEALPSKLLNEEGLPIIDISEPVNGDSQPIISFPVQDQELIPFSLLSPEERERRRRDRDRVLDLLEEEERLQQLREERDAEQERKEAVKRRKESAKAELEQLKAARDLEKKMGQALVRRAKDVGESRQEDDAQSKSQNTSAGKKTVSFADAPAVEVDERDKQSPIPQYDWGDVVPGRLRAKRGIPLMTTADEEKYPMKMRVVERHPSGTTTHPSHGDADSDDESPSENSFSLRDKSSDEENGSSSSNNGFSEDEPLEEGFDYDVAQHHREIALEYHRKRDAVGAEAAKAMAAFTPSDDYEQQETSKERLPLSRFRADRMSAVYDKSHDPVSTSIGQSLIPVSRQKSLRNSVRLGKLENDQLLGGESGESGSEDETVREVIQMLKTGNIQNIGPDLEPSSLSRTLRRNSDTAEPPSVGTSTAYGTKPSKFKLARRGSITDTSAAQDDSRQDDAPSQPAISSVVERKAPRSFLINKPSHRSAVKTPEPAFPMIIDSPSFPETPRAPPGAPGRPVSRFVSERTK